MKLTSCVNILLVTCSLLANSLPVSAQHTILHNFNDGTVTNDGAYPFTGNLIEGPDGNFYGTTSAGGSQFEGAVYKITRQGTITILHSFNDGSIADDGVSPSSGLTLGRDGNLYGTTAYGGSTISTWPGLGTIYKISLQGEMTILHSFGDGSVTNDGANPNGALTLGRDGNFYGTTISDVTGSTLPGGASNGTVFKLTPQGKVTILHHFGDGNVANDGAQPNGGLIQAWDGDFYGTTLYGGGDPGFNGFGTVYKISPQGKETILHHFSDGTVVNDGYAPQSGLIQARNGDFYGTTEVGGASGQFGTVYRMTRTGNVTILHSFGDPVTKNDGQQPFAALVEAWDGNFYGTTITGGSAGEGTAFKITPKGKLTVLHSFGDGTILNDGANPYGALNFSCYDGYFYGVTYQGGSANVGTVFKFPYWLTSRTWERMD